MFGYVTIRKDDLKVKDYNKYQAYYCGLCQDIKEAYGKKGQAMLTFDMTFLSILLTGLYECETKEEEHYCFLHPGKKHPLDIDKNPRARANTVERALDCSLADMNVLLAYYNLLDDWEDEKNYAAFTAAKALKKSVTRIEASYPRQTKAVQDYLEKLHACEKENNPDLDLAAGYTGEVMAEIYIPEEDIWSDDLRQVGFYIGKFIYLMDALDDVEKDKKSGNYNPFLSIADQPDFEKTAEKILLMMTAEASRAFEKLPILENVDILRNILYAGIWEKYEMRKSAKERQKEEK